MSCIAPSPSNKKSKLKFEDDETLNNNDPQIKKEIRGTINNSNSNSLFEQFNTIIKSNCNKCHNNESTGNFVRLRTQEDWINSKFVTTNLSVKRSDFPYKSSIYNKLKKVTLAGNMPPGKNNELSVIDRGVIKDWLNSLPLKMKNRSPIVPPTVVFNAKTYFKENCFKCHQDKKKGSNLQEIKNGIRKYSGMFKFKSLSDKKLQALADYLSSQVQVPPVYNCKLGQTKVRTCTNIPFSKKSEILSQCKSDRSGYYESACTAKICFSNTQKYTYKLENGACVRKEEIVPQETKTYDSIIYLPMHLKDADKAIDKSGNHHHGIIKNGAKILKAKGVVLDGNDDYIDLGNFTFGGNKLTITSKFKSYDINNCKSADCRIFSQANGTAAANHTIMLSTIKSGNEYFLRVRVKINGTTYTIIAKQGAIKNNQIVNASITYDGNVLKLYKDAIEVGSLPIKGSITIDKRNKLLLGVNQENGERAFKGEIQSFSIHKRVLSVNEIKAFLTNSHIDNSVSIIPIVPPVVPPRPVLPKDKEESIQVLRASLGSDFENDAISFLRINCIGCHSANADTKIFKVNDILNIDKLLKEKLIIPGQHNLSPLWKLTHDKKMPPAGKTSGDLNDVKNWINGLKKSANIDCGDTKVFVGLNNLNRYQLNNTINDLFYLNLDISNDLPEDFYSGIFDNQSGESNLSPLYIDKLLSLSKKIFKQIHLNSTAQNILYTCKEKSDACLKKIIIKILPRAYRRPVTLEEVNKIYNTAKNSDLHVDFKEKIQTLIDIIIINPTFLHRIEGISPINKTGELTDHEIAARVSYGLLGTSPNIKMVIAANKGQFHTAAQIKPFITEIIKSRRFITHLSKQFSEQWLNSNAVKSVTIDSKLFPQFNDELRNAMSLETKLVFEDILKSNQSLNSLLSTNFTYLNQALAKHYNISGVTGNHMRKVFLDNVNTRGGLMTHGSVLTQTSKANEPSVVHRGLLVLDRLLCSPPSPPENMNILEMEVDIDDSEDFLTLRERLREHTNDSTCQGCHQYIDPYAFGQLNFGTIGEFRLKETYQPKSDSGYYIWVLAMGESSSKDSFYISINDKSYSSKVAINNLAPYGKFIWKKIVTPTPLALNIGNHKVYIKNREVGASLDKIIITNDKNFDPTTMDKRGFDGKFEYIHIEAENSIRSSNVFKIVNNNNNSGGQYIQNTSRNQNKSSAAQIDNQLIGELQYNFVTSVKGNTKIFEKLINSSSELVTGERFNGIFEMQEVMSQRPEFKNCSGFRLSSFLLGTELNNSSRCEIKKIIKENPNQGISDFIQKLYETNIFLKRAK